MLDRLVDTAVKFAEEDEGSYVSDDGRDALGQRIPEDSPRRTMKGAFPLHPMHAAQHPLDFDTEDYDQGLADEGRDPITGVRVAPLDDEEE